MSVAEHHSVLAPLQQVAESEPQDRGVLQYPADLSNRELPTAALSQLQPVITQVGELSTAFAEGSDRQTVLGPIQAATYRAASSAWRGSEQEVLDGAGHAADAVEAVREKIRIVPPSNGSYTLSASDAPLVFTIENNLRVPVSFRIGLDPRLSSGLVPADIGVQTIPALSRSTVRLPTKVERSGTFSVVAQIMTPESKPLGKDVRVQVSSSAHGAVALIVTGGAIALLLRLIARRWWRKRLFWAEQRAEAQAAQDGEQGAAPAADGDPAEPDRTERRRGRGGTVRSHEAREPGPDPRLEDEPR